MTRSLNLIIVVITLLTAGCASNSGEYPSSRTPSSAPSSPNKALKCNANEVLICEARSPHRVSDGRYGRKNNKSKKCSCQPETDLSNMMQIDVLGEG